MMLRSLSVSVLLFSIFISNQNASADISAPEFLQPYSSNEVQNSQNAESSSLTDKELKNLFTKREILLHRARIAKLTHASAVCLVDTYREHVEFYQKWHVSKFYGDRKKENATEALRLEQLKKYGAPAYLIKDLEPISCIGLTIRCLEKGFTVAGLGPTWQKIYARLAYQNNFYGTDLQKMLIQLGWTSLYWNPDPTQNVKWDHEDHTLIPAPPGKNDSPAWGDHVEHYNEVMKAHKYAGIPVANSRALVGFKNHVPLALRGVPFYVGTAHSGYHVFPGFDGNVIEAHSTRPLNSFENLQVSLFNPTAGGGPMWTENLRYRSGLVVVPPRPHRDGED